MSEEINKNPFEEILFFTRETISEEINCQLLGQILTIIDGTIIDKQQNKAIKDLIRSRFSSTNRKIMKVIKDYIFNQAELEGQEIKKDQSEHF